MGHWYVSNAEITLANVSATIPVLFLMVHTGTAYQHLFNVADTDVEMCKSFDLKKALYDSSTVAQMAERFEPNTVLWAFHTLHPSSSRSISAYTTWT